MLRPVPSFVRKFIEAGEGREYKSYPDTNGTWSIGVGHTGINVYPGLIWTDAQIDDQLDKDIAQAVERLEKRLKPAVLLSLTDHQYGALISFVFNLGANASWKIWKVINGQSPTWEADTEAELKRFVHEKVDGVARIVPGLVARRDAEIAMFKIVPLAPKRSMEADLKAAVAAAAAAPEATPSSVLRESETPPTPQPQPLMKRKSMFSGISAALISVPVFLKDILETFLKPVMDAITPFSGQSAHVSQVIGIMASVAAGLVALTIILQAIERKREKN